MLPDKCNHQNIKKQFIEHMATSMSLYGMTIITGRLFGILFFSGRALTMDEMAEELEMNKSSVSSIIRVLLEQKMVRAIYNPNNLKYLFESEKDLRKPFIQLLTKERKEALESNVEWRKAMASNIEKSIAAQKKLQALKLDMIDPSECDDVQRDIERLKEVNQFYEWVIQFIGRKEHHQVD